MSILLSELTKRYGENIVVNRVSLEVSDGELFVLLGSSGSGKSTVLRMVAGLTPVDEGRVELNRRDVTGLPPQKRGTGFVFQNYSIFRHMTVAENIEFGLRIRKAPGEERRSRSEELLDLVGLAGLGARYPEQLSGGQQQRVALARALAYQPDVLLLDEPFGALDVKIRAQLRESLKEIQRRLKVTTLLVTHDQEEAFELGDRIGVMERGALIEIGRPEELYHRPQTEYAATFIGGGNVLVGRAIGGKIKLGSTVLPFPDDAPGHDEGAPVRILFRPESVELRNRPFDARSGIHPLASGKVLERIFAGSQQRIRLEVDGLQGVRTITPPPVYGRQTTQIDVLKTSAAGPETLAPGQNLWIGLKRYHVLSPAGLKILICVGQKQDGEIVAASGSYLSRAALGATTLLSVVKADEAPTPARENLETLRRRFFAGSPLVETSIRQGTPVEEILLESQEGLYELIILGKNSLLSQGLQTSTGSTARQVLARAETPVMVVPGPFARLERILICTAAGEPGKSDVLFGGRVARQIGASITVFHVLRTKTSRETKRRIERHLHQAQISLQALGISSEGKIEKQAPLLTSILREADEGGYDLIVIGAPAPRAPQQIFWPDLASQIIRKSQRPILVVPMME